MIDRMHYIETETEKYPYTYTFNVIEAIQEKYGTVEAWADLIMNKDGNAEKFVEPNIKALKFFITEAINEGIDIENEKSGEKRKPITSKKAGRILTEIGPSCAAGKIMEAISDSLPTGEQTKNIEATKSQAE